MNNLKSIVYLFIVFIFLYSCESNEEIYHDGLTESTYDSRPLSGQLTIEKAQEIYYKNHLDLSSLNYTIDFNYANQSEDECIKFEPIWFLSNNISSIEGHSMLVVPVRIPEEYNIPGRGA